jgi:PAS domain S-box-containing protein
VATLATPQPVRIDAVNPRATKRSWPLRADFAVVALLVVLVGAAAGAFVHLRSDEDARQAAEADANFAARKAAAQINSGLDIIKVASTQSTVANAPSLAQVFSNPSLCRLGNAPVGAFDTTRIDLVRLDGSVVCSSRKPVATGTVFAGQSWLQTTTPAFVAPIVDPLTGREVAVISYPVGNLGVIAWFLDLEPVGPKLASEFGSGVEQLEFLVTSSDGKAIIARSIDSAKWIGAAIDGTPFAAASDPVDRSDVDGMPRWYGQASVNAAGWKVNVGADKAVALADAARLQNQQLEIVGAGVVAVLLALLVVYRRVVRPIEQLSERVGRVTTEEGGDLVATRGPTEVATLANNFNQMMASVKRELAERRRAETSAQISESNYRLLFEGSQVAMFVYDIETLKVLEANEAALALYGYSRQEFEEITVSALRSPADGPFSQDFSRPEGYDRSLPDRHRKKDGSIVEATVAAHNLTYAGRNARFVMVEDKTERELLERQLQQEQARLEASAELNRVKDELISMVSHELRTPLASLVGFTELLQSREYAKAQRKHYLDVMLREGRRLTSLINDFLDLQRMEGGAQMLNLGPADLGALVHRAVTTAGEDLRTPIKVELDDHLGLVIADPDRILQVLTNLLSNARKYSPEGGEIRVFAQVADQVVEVSVQDQGLGIPSEARAHLFERFFRIDRGDHHEIRGTGLGLSITQRIIEGHGGKVGVESEGPGKGSRFYFTLALAPSSSTTGDVLIVEDDAGFVRLLRAELATKGLSVIWAPDAETAEAVMDRAMPQAVVLDLLLPGLQGEDFLTRHHAANRAMGTLVVVTVKDLSATEIAALHALGVTAVLRKQPHVAKEAVDIIAKAIVTKAIAKAS